MRLSPDVLRTLSSLPRTTRGNIAILTAFSIIPLLAMIGSAIDASRTYMAYTRLQQACDAGALAGRKAMSNITRLSDAEKAKANEFFRFNFPAGTYAAEKVTAVFDKGADGIVVGKASLSMPTTLMRMFGFGSIPVNASCQAEMNVPNTDVMFVLDVTGSMGWRPDGSGANNASQTRLYGLKQAVKDFYAELGPGKPSGAGRIRYGFVPYNSNVNVGRILYDLNPSYIYGGRVAEDWTYSSREVVTRQRCNGGGCETYLDWERSNLNINVRPYVINRSSVANPAYWTGNPAMNNYDAPARFVWAGCIEEAGTVPTITRTSSLEVPVGADDLQIDLKPTQGLSRWKPALGELMYKVGDPYQRQADPCPPEAGVLEQYTSDYDTGKKESVRFDRYVDSLAAGGGTYHDIGLMWGARFLSPRGIFSDTNSDAAAPGGYQVSRHIVFMTDGALQTYPNNPDAWGINQVDGRIAPTSANNRRTDESHLRRTQIICNEMKKRGFIIWIVGFGTSGLSQELKECASDDDHWSIATDTAALRKSFAKIAQTIGGLRLS